MDTYFTVLPPEEPIDTLDSIAQFSIDNHAQLFVIVVSVAFVVPGTVFPGVPSYGGEAEFALLHKQSKLRAKELEKRLADAGVSYTVITVCQPIISIAEAIYKNALYADLAILPAKNKFSASIYRRILEGLLFDAGLPTIVLPDNLVKPLKLNKLLVGWYPSTHAAKALRDSTRLLSHISDIRIAIIDSSAEIYGPVPGDDVATYLARKGLNVTIEKLSGNNNGVTSTLKQAAIDFDTDLIVIGAYGHSRMRETLFGGTTKQMLAQPPCPMLLSH